MSLNERIDNRTWPNAGKEMADIECVMRYSENRNVYAASIIRAYRELLTCTPKKREYVVRELRKRREG